MLTFVLASLAMALDALGSGWLSRVERVLGALAPERRVEPQACDALCRFLDLVVTWNRRMDLTAARDADELADLIVADAAMLVAQGTDADQHWVDVGSGAGAPGIALALLAPELRITLVEPRQKRVAFLRTALSTLGRSDVHVERKRAQDLPARFATVAVSRATLPPAEWLPEGARLATQSVWVLVAREALPTLGGYEPAQEIEYCWPLTGVSRRAARYVQRT